MKHAPITAAPFALDADEMARDAADEAARWNRYYANGDWNLDEYLLWTGQTLESFMPIDSRVAPL